MRRDGRPFAWGGYLAALLPLAVGAGLTLLALDMRGAVSRSKAREATTPGFPVTLTEVRRDGEPGRKVTIPARPERIVSVTLATDEMLLALVPPSRIAALSDVAPNPRFSPIRDKLEGVAHFVGNDSERIVALRPDLCFIASYTQEKTRKALETHGIPVFTFHCFTTLDDIRRNIRTVGKAVGETDKAGRLVAEMNAKLKALARRLPPRSEWPTALFCFAGGHSGAGDTTYTAVLEAAGVKNALAEAGFTGYPKVDAERIVSLDPDYFIVGVGADGKSPAEAWLKSLPALTDLRALKEDRFLRVRAPVFSSCSQHVADAVVEIASQLYPKKDAR